MEGYGTITKEQLEEELFKIYQKHNLEYYNEDMTVRYDKLKSCTEVGVFGGDIDKVITIMRTLHDKPDLRRFYPDKKRILIHPVETTREPVYEDFISRVDFINQTGIFVSPGYFETIYDDFKDSGVSVDEFVGNYEAKYSTCVEELELKGTLKYETTDDAVSCLCVYNSDPLYEPNIWEVVNNLAVEYDHQWRSKDETVEKYQKIIKELQDINARLMDIATRQIYQ
ncbi:hypothetical protein [Lacrimispora sp.]|uniref:hypothetical protein n=1 Tax=Lacrimispora sp. TaxID=2719234 RepID=UPI0028B0BE9B|nr:hypothetical protein [Lacrimispora sp.]